MIDINAIKQEYEDILTQLSDPELISNREKFENLLKKRDYFEKIIEKEKEIKDLEQKIQENKEILSTEKDPELLSLAEAEIKIFAEKEKNSKKELETLLKKEESFSSNFVLQNFSGESVIVEIRAGTGGEEASLFAGDLFRMYLKYATIQSWKQKILDSRPTELSGFKEITFELKNGNVFSKMQHEGGVHRVQRIPATEKSGRIHTSTATVAILPKPKKAQIKINPRDLKIDFYGASGPGGQYLQKRHTAVRITHLPTGIVVTSQTERNQIQNKENAISILEARLLKRKEMAEFEKLSEKRKTQIGWAKRAEKIRTYNFPQDRVTDHRIKKSWHNIEDIMAGRLESIIKALQAP